MTANPLVGTWRLVSFEARDEDGRVSHPFGRDAVGFITDKADGRMSVHFGRSDRARLVDGDWMAASPAEIAAAAGDYFAYCGAYHYRDGEVVHRIDLNLIPNRIGGEQVRRVEVDGDIATLTTASTPIGRLQQIGVLIWQRV